MVVSEMTKDGDRVVVEHGTEGAPGRVAELSAAGYERKDRRRYIDWGGNGGSFRVWWGDA